jgi:endogenous inhibitor of DNA gyrase (YacG/DUF329 family)
MVKTCKGCKKTFTANNRTSGRKYCSRECKMEAFARMHATVPCKYCGAPVRRVVYCSPEHREAERIKVRESILLKLRKLKSVGLPAGTIASRMSLKAETLNKINRAGLAKYY